MRILTCIFAAVLFFASFSYADIQRPDTVKEVFFTGTNYELEVYKIYGREDGPTMLIIGGIQGDEPGGFLSADSYADVKLKKGNLIVIPRTNFYSIMLFNREVKGVDMNRLFDKTPNDWQGDIVNKIKEYMKLSDIFLNLHDGWGFHYPEHISWHKSPDRFGYSVIVDEDEYLCSNGKILKLGEMAKKAMEAANAAIPDDDPKMHYFNTETGRQNSRFKSMKKSATWYAVSDLCIPAFGVEGSKNMELDKNVLYHNFVINEFMKNAGIEIEYPSVKDNAPEFIGAAIKINNDELFIRNGGVLEVEKGSSIKVTEIFANYQRGLTCDIINYGNLNDINKDYVINSGNKIVFRRDNIIIGSITLKPVVKEKNEHTAENNKKIENSAGEKEINKTKLVPGVKYFHLIIDNKDVYVQNNDKIHIKNGSKVVLVKLFSSETDDYNVAVNFKGWFPEKYTTNMGDDRGYEILFPPANILKKYSVGADGKLYPVVAHDIEKNKDIAKIMVELD